MPRALAFALLVVSSGCNQPFVRRDLGSVPPGQVGYDDLCGLQEYFDTLELGLEKEPRVLASTEAEAKRASGRSRFAFETEFQLAHARRVLDQNWARLPPELAAAKRLEIEVRWAERAGVRRVLTVENAELAIEKRRWPLPYHPCLSEWLFGAPLYKQRRETLGLPLVK